MSTFEDAQAPSKMLMLTVLGTLGHLGAELALPARLPELRDLPDPDQRNSIRLSAVVSDAVPAQARKRRLEAVAIIGLGPIPAAWLLVCGLVALVRWIRRGFEPST